MGYGAGGGVVYRVDRAWPGARPRPVLSELALLGFGAGGGVAGARRDSEAGRGFPVGLQAGGAWLRRRGVARRPRCSGPPRKAGAETGLAVCPGAPAATVGPGHRARTMVPSPPRPQLRALVLGLGLALLGVAAGERAPGKV